MSATVASLMPATATISPACASSTGTRSRPRNAKTFESEIFDQRAIVADGFDHHIRLHDARRDTADRADVVDEAGDLVSLSEQGAEVLLAVVANAKVFVGVPARVIFV